MLFSAYALIHSQQIRAADLTPREVLTTLSRSFSTQCATMRCSRTDESIPR